MTAGRMGWLASLLVVGLLVVPGCGAAGDDGASGGGGGPTVAAPDLAGRWTVSIVEVEGTATRPITALVELETDFGGVQVDTDCGTSIGAFTLDADGVAGFSLTGGSTVDCAGDTRIRSDLLLSVLAGVDAWSGDGQRLELTGPDDSRVELSR